MRNRSVTYSVDAAFHALSDPTRRTLLGLLRTKGTQSAGTIAECFTISRPAISKHLRILRSAYLVREQRRGRHRLYQLNAEPLRAVDGWLNDYREFWQARLHDLKEYVEGEAAHHSRRSLPRHLRGRKRNDND